MSKMLDIIGYGLELFYSFPSISHQPRKEVKHSIQQISNQPTLTISFIRKLHLQALDAEYGEQPQAVNPILAVILYELQYREIWRGEIKKVKDLSLHICVTGLITHIVNETKLAYKGTKYEETYLFYHDALQQMTDIILCKSLVNADKKVFLKF